MTNRIIIAENEEIVGISQRYAVPAGTVIEEVTDGKPLVEKVRAGNYDLIITDHKMPSVSGLEAIKQIRGFNKEIPIIMVAGSLDRKIALEAGANDYIEKPFDLDDFRERISQYLNSNSPNNH